MKMHTYYAFIDESGDDGLGKFRQHGQVGGGSSWWLVISCAIYRASRSTEAVAWRDEIKSLCGISSSRRALHFADLKHSQKRVACQVLAKRPIRLISVIARKNLLTADYRMKNQLYFYMTRYLIERLSWFAGDYRKHAREGDGSIKITFSRRGGMDYDAFRDYLSKLKSCDQGTSIQWPVIDIQAISVQSHSTNASLQLADIGASAVASAVEPDRFGNVESAYLEALKPCVYHRNSNYFSYGLKFINGLEEAKAIPGVGGIKLFEERRQPPGP